MALLCLSSVARREHPSSYTENSNLSTDPPLTAAESEKKTLRPPVIVNLSEMQSFDQNMSHNSRESSVEEGPSDKEWSD